MHFVYVLKSVTENWVYVGMTRNVTKRICLHNKGKVKSTRAKRPFKLIYKENCEDSKEARKREKYFKNNAGKEYLKRKGLL
jgi:putative endonuclease